MEKRTEIGDLGEFGLIEQIKTLFNEKNKDTLIGIGDDAAVISIDESKKSVISTELFIEGIHFDLSYFPLKHLGYKIAVAGISDIAAMNGIPKHILINIGLSNRFSVEAVQELYWGMKAACDDFDINLIGGDTSASRSGLVISITAVGQVEENKIVRRSAAKTNDIICVTGDLGAAFLGLQLLEREKAVFQANPNAQPELDDYEYVVSRQLKPTARMDIIHHFAELNIVPTAMIDVSDGLASDLLHLCKQSNVGANIFEEKLPIDDQSYLAATALNISPITAAMNGGEDFELLFTINQADFEKLKPISDIIPIGYITDKGQEIQLVMKSGQTIPLSAQGWNKSN
jgi:thiamine-monophosphate kinase